jgi:hypothetical protein
MRAKLGTRSVLTALLLVACAPPPSQPVDSPAFVRRAPPPGQPGYLETISYIADGLRYISPGATFFVSSAGEMCFQGMPDPDRNPYAVPADYWCISPLAVGSVDTYRNDVTYIGGVRLWCRITAPQCAHKIGYPNFFDQSWIANSVTAETVPSQHQQAAIEHLIYLMGGDVGAPEPPGWGRNAVLGAAP